MRPRDMIISMMMSNAFRRVRLAVLSAAAALAAVPLIAAPISGELDGRIDAGLSLLYQGHYEEALDTFRSFSGAHPANPAGQFFIAGAYQLRGLAYASDAWDGPYRNALDSALELSDRAIGRDPRDPWAHFFRGGTFAYMASRDARNGSLLAALNKGLSGMSALKRAVELDPALYDAYLGLGSYHYFRTKAASIFKWLPFIGDRREQGVRELRTAAAQGRYTRVMAMNALMWVLIDYGKLDQALETALQLEKEYPANHAFHWGAAEVHYKRGQWGPAGEAYHRLLRLNQDAKPMNNYNRVFIDARLAKCRYEQGRYAEAESLAREAITAPLTEDDARRLQRERSRAQQVLKQSGKMAGGKQP
jgi:tetratricopeptide (TPR) repeat protein